MNLFLRCMNVHSHPGIFSQCVRNCRYHCNPANGCPYKCFQVLPQDPVFYPMILDIESAVDVSKEMDILILAISKNLGLGVS